MGDGAQVCGAVRRVGELEGELVARAAVAADERQAVGRRQLGDLQASARLGPEEPREEAPFGSAKEGGDAARVPSTRHRGEWRSSSR